MIRRPTARSQAICYAITADKKYVDQLLLSLKSLRGCGSKITVFVHVFGRLTKKDTHALKKFSVTIKNHSVPKKIYPYLIKWLALDTHKEDQVLFLDADTWISKKPETFLGRLWKKDFYSRPEIGSGSRTTYCGSYVVKPQINHSAFAQIFKEVGARRSPPLYNIGVMVLNRRVQKKISFRLLKSYYDKITSGEWPYPSINWHIRGELCLRIALAKRDEISLGNLSRTFAPFFVELREGVAKDPGSVLHIWNGFYSEFLKSKYC